MMNAVLKGWVFSTKKACISNRVTFRGLDLRADNNKNVHVLPEINRISALTELPAPKTKREAQSLIGLLVSFSKWIPGLTKKMINIKQSTTAGTHFSWSPEMQSELVELCNVVSKLLPLAPFDPAHQTYIYVDASYLDLQLRDGSLLRDHTCNVTLLRI